MSTLAIDLVTDTAGLHSLASDWRDLWRRVPGASPFQSPEWLLPWWQVFGTPHPVTAVLHDGERLRGLLPLYVLEENGSRKLLPIGVGISDYCDALLDPTMPADAAGRMLNAAWRHGRNVGAAVCDLVDVPPDAVLRDAMPGLTWCDTEPCPVLFVPPGAADAEGAVPSRQRRKLRMNRHRAQRAGGWGVEFADSAALLQPLLHLHSQRWNIVDPAVSDFHRLAVPRLLSAGLLRLASLRIGGRLAACCYALADRRDRLMFYMIGFESVFAAVSPGTLLVAAMIDAAIAEGRREIHFLRGDEAYKYAWGAQDRRNAACRLEVLHAASN